MDGWAPTRECSSSSLRVPFGSKPQRSCLLHRNFKEKEGERKLSGLGNGGMVGGVGDGVSTDEIVEAAKLAAAERVGAVAPVAAEAVASG